MSKLRASRNVGHQRAKCTSCSGPSVSPEGLEGGFDWALVVRFRDAAARDAYLPHPAHQPVADHIGARSARVVVFDVAG